MTNISISYEAGYRCATDLIFAELMFLYGNYDNLLGECPASFV